MIHTIKSVSVYSIYTLGVVPNFDIYSHMLLTKTWSEQKSRFELIAARLKLAESVDTVGEH